MQTSNMRKTLTVLAAGLILGACTSNGLDGADTGAITGGNGSTNGGLANDGTTATDITNNGTKLSGNFICSRSVLQYGPATTKVGSNGLIGGLLTTLLNLLGGTTLTQLLNSVSNANNAIDGNLDTYASVSLTLGLLGGLLDSVDESVLLPSGATVPAGKFAVFGLTFPKGTVSLSLFSQVKVSTFLNGVAQESNTLSQSELALLGAIGGSNPPAVFVGVQTTKPYDTAQVSLTPGLLSVNVGDAMRIHELCTDGSLVN